jgi:hypothetical protein
LLAARVMADAKAALFCGWICIFAVIFLRPHFGAYKSESGTGRVKNGSKPPHSQELG